MLLAVGDSRQRLFPSVGAGCCCCRCRCYCWWRGGEFGCWLVCGAQFGEVSVSVKGTGDNVVVPEVSVCVKGTGNSELVLDVTS